MKYPDGSEIEYSYTAKGLLEGVKDGNGGRTSYAYDGLDRVVVETLDNGVQTTKAYDPLSRVLEIRSTNNDGGLINGFSYTYDPVGNKLKEIEEVYKNKNKTEIFSTSYAYDALDQLVEVVEPTGIKKNYFYDTVGNRVQKENALASNNSSSAKTNKNKKNKKKDNSNNNSNTRSTTITRYTYDLDNHLLSMIGQDEEIAGHVTSELVKFTYDARVNNTKIETESGITGQYYYDSTNKMTYSVNKKGITSEYIYDGLGRRVGQAMDHSNINVSENSALKDQESLESRVDYGIIINVKAEINYILDTTSRKNDVLMVYGEHTKTQRYTYGLDVISLDT